MYYHSLCPTCNRKAAPHRFKNMVCDYCLTGEEPGYVNENKTLVNNFGTDKTETPDNRTAQDTKGDKCEKK